jgi:hypothetical protein
MTKLTWSIAASQTPYAACIMTMRRLRRRRVGLRRNWQGGKEQNKLHRCNLKESCMAAVVEKKECDGAGDKRKAGIL